MDDFVLIQEKHYKRGKLILEKRINKRGQLVEYIQYHGKSIDKIYTLNEKGGAIRINYLHNSKLLTVHQYNYDKCGNEIEHFIKQVGDAYVQILKNYNSKQQVIRINIESPSSKSTIFFDYNNAGQCNKKSYYKEGVLAYEMHFIYEQGYLVKEKCFIDDKKHVWESQVTYNYKNQRTSIDFYKRNTLFYRITYAYDENDKKKSVRKYLNNEYAVCFSWRNAGKLDVALYAQSNESMPKKYKKEKIKRKLQELNDKLKAEERRVHTIYSQLKMNAVALLKSAAIDDYKCRLKISLFSFDEEVLEKYKVDEGCPLYETFALTLPFEKEIFDTDYKSERMFDVPICYSMHYILDHVRLPLEMLFSISLVEFDIDLQYQLFIEKEGEYLS